MFTSKEFTLTDKEYEQIKNWADTHNCCCRYNGRPSRSPIGGELSITFTPTSIGTAISVKCTCGEELDLDTL